MALPIISLLQNSQEIKLVYNAGVQEDYRTRYGGGLQQNEGQVRWFQPDDGTRQLLNISNDLVTAFYTLNVHESTDVADVIENIAVLKRWVDGADQEAARYWLYGDVSRVNLKLQRRDKSDDTQAGVATLWPVIMGFVDDGGSHFTAVADLNDLAQNVVVGLTLAPMGERSDYIELKSDLQNGNFLQVGSPNPGAPAAWELVGSTSASEVTADTNTYLLGGQSYKITASAASEGIAYSFGSVNDDIAAYACILVSSGTVRVRLQNTTGGTEIDAYNVTTAGVTGLSTAKKYTDANGNVWYRVPLSGNSGGAVTVKLQAFSQGAAATFYIDAAWGRTGTQSIPDAWCSYSTITMRADRDATNPEYHNFVEVGLIPGDQSALTVIDPLFETVGDSAAKTLYAARRRDGSVINEDFKHWYEAEDKDATVSTGGSWATTVDASASGGNYERYTDGGSGNSNGQLRFDAQSLTDAQQFHSGPKRMFVVARSNDTAAYATMFITDNSGEFLQGDITTANKWELLDMGIINGRNLISSEATGYSPMTFSLKANVVAALATMDFDGFYFLPVEDDGTIIISVPGMSAGTTKANMVGAERRVVYDNGLILDHRGNLWTAKPGITTNRYYFLHRTTSDNDFTIADTMTITIKVLPRTRSLLTDTIG